MKKFIVLTAIMAATSTAFIACSSDDDLAQQPTAPETIVENGTSEGTPFSVNPSSDVTRAVRYGASAWGNYVDNSTPYVNCFKLYGKQSGLDAWINNVVFTREKTGANANIWGPNRIQSTPVASLSWPKDDTETPLVKESEVATNFYAITDNAIYAGNHATKADGIDGVSQWMNTEGSFTYTLAPKTNTSAMWFDNDAYAVAATTVKYVDLDELKDLMYATTTKTEADVTDGKLPLSFHHALSGLSLKLRFLSNSEKNNNVYARVYAVMFGGLYTSGSFAMNPVTGLGEWPTSDLSTPVCYYKYFDTPIDVPAIYEKTNTAAPTNVSTDKQIADATQQVIDPGELLVIPQTTTPWDYSYTGTVLPTNSTSAYVALWIGDSYGVSDPMDNNMILYYPLNTTFNAGKTRAITIDIAQGRAWDEQGNTANTIIGYDTTDPTDPQPIYGCALHFNPAEVFASREYEFE